MKKVYVTATLYYGYVVEVPDDVTDEVELFDFAVDNDPIEFDQTKVDEPAISINGIFDEQGNILYSKD